MAMTVEKLINQFEHLEAKEKERFLASLMRLVARRAFAAPDRAAPKTYSHIQVFGELEGALFTFAEACEYLERSAPQVRRYVAEQAIVPAKSIGKNQMFDLAGLKAFKKTLRAKPAASVNSPRPSRNSA